MMTRLHLSVILAAAALIWGALLVLEGVAIPAHWIRPLSSVTGIMVLLLICFDVFLWKLPFLQGWFVKRPLIFGTWRVVIRSNWNDPSTGRAVKPIEGYMVIRQTFSSLSLRLYTKESCSELLGVEINGARDGMFRLVGVYRNEPLLSARERSSIHHGALLLQVIGFPSTALKGSYWTDRNTAGEIELSARHKETFDDFESARAAFATARSRSRKSDA